LVETIKAGREVSNGRGSSRIWNGWEVMMEPILNMFVLTIVAVIQ
jgi:hypothetical protein